MTGVRSRLLESLPARNLATSGPRKVAVLLIISNPNFVAIVNASSIALPCVAAVASAIALEL